MKMLLKEFNNLKIIMKELILVKIINLPRPTFEMYITVFNKKTRIEKILLDLDMLLKSLEEEEEIWLSGKNLLNTV